MCVCIRDLVCMYETICDDVCGYGCMHEVCSTCICVEEAGNMMKLYGYTSSRFVYIKEC